MTSINKPMTLIGKQLSTPPHKKNTYRTKAYVSAVDETLFGTPTRYTQQLETKHLSDEKDWDPPWVTSPTKKGAPLLWTPFTYQDFQGSLAPTSGETPRSRSKPATPRSSRASSKYRMRSHTPSYVDETLFGPKLVEPSFKAPWEETDGSSGGKHLLWSPQINHQDSPRSDNSFDERPGSRLGEYFDPYIPPTPRDGPSDNSLQTPVIKQRTGSNIKASSHKLPPRVGDRDNMKLKLNFDEQNQMEKEELIERALRLARQAQEAALQNTQNPQARQVWSRPSSARSSSRMSSRKSHRLSDFVEFDHLSATGIQVPLSARGSDTGSRPNSARVRSRSAQRPHSARLSSDRPSWRP